jgi:6-pyruvoyltetrahydropterin/6-carboxytetrahydropterin synthase
MQLQLHLFKENFKFSSAHFLIFNETQAEKLHGHNYQVYLDIEVPKGGNHLAAGFFIDFAELKQDVKKIVDEWDERVLLPRHPEMKYEQEGPTLKVHFRDRYYAFPREEVVILDVTNTSVENLSILVAQKLAHVWKPKGLSKIQVRVEETRGQSASCRLDF